MLDMGEQDSFPHQSPPLPTGSVAATALVTAATAATAANAGTTRLERLADDHKDTPLQGVAELTHNSVDAGANRIAATAATDASQGGPNLNAAGWENDFEKAKNTGKKSVLVTHIPVPTAKFEAMQKMSNTQPVIQNLTSFVSPILPHQRVLGLYIKPHTKHKAHDSSQGVIDALYAVIQTLA